MRIIEKIEIENFRSFLGTTQDDKAEILDIKDLNIFSGSNDSGKSNILRALNLFFNNVIDSTRQFNFDTEFTMLRKDPIHKVIEIKLHFVVSKRKFSISKFYNRDGLRNFEYTFIENGEKIKIDSRPEKNTERYGELEKDGKIIRKEHRILKKEKGLRTYVTQFLYSISFSYVPAIRDERFFSHLYGKIILQIKNNEEKALNDLSILKNKIDKWDITLKKDNKTESSELKKNLINEEWRKYKLAEIEKEIKKRSILGQSVEDLEKRINSMSERLFDSTKFLASEFKIRNNLREFFESFDIGTGEQKDISLRLRGDGVQAKFIPEMLDFLDEIQTKKYSIWGFEEPENSAEYKNQQILARKFKDDFSKRKQIFLTTHSEEFLSMYDDEKVEKDERTANLYHVKQIIHKKLEKEFSVINLFDVEKQSFEFATTKSNLEEDIGTSLIRAKYSKELKEKENSFLKAKEKLEVEILHSEEVFNQQISKFKNAFPEKIFICEDERGTKVWEAFFKEFDIKNVAIISSKGCTVNDVEIWIRENRKHQANYLPKVFRSLDRDGYTLQQIDFLETELKDKNEKNIGVGNYKVKLLPVNELENFAILQDMDFTDDLIEKNINELENAFTSTVTSSLDHNHRKFSSDTELFNRYKDHLLIKNMERNAKKDVKKFFPGKDIKALKNNFSAERFLKQLKFEDYPDELTNYLIEIKLFFEQ